MDLIEAAQPARARKPEQRLGLIRSAYLQQVRRIAPPPGLIGREAELAELAAVLP